MDLKRKSLIVTQLFRIITLLLCIKNQGLINYKRISQRFEANNYFAATINQAEKLYRFIFKSIQS